MAARHEPMGPRCLATALAGIALLATPAGAAPNDGVGNDDAPPCITVEVNGQRALPYECLQEKMAPSQAGEQVRNRPRLNAESVINQSPNRSGQFSRSTLRNRMGNTFGQGVRPQRPARREAPPPLPR
ncbi:hypothetical protein ACLD02_16180 [Alloalcanivorax sp. C16-2]|uniref:hypothetical protein n=1 Tax=Alloalcanivorax sp. C16-2 TaxID=3390052 RepID=UPI003970BD21